MELDNQQLINYCPFCNEKEMMRPYGSDLLCGKDGGCYYKICNSCKTAYAFNKEDNETKFKGTMEGLIHFQHLLKRRGIF